jgi:hypothetical protein
LLQLGLEQAPEEKIAALNLAWRALDAWPDVGEGLDILRKGYILAPFRTEIFRYLLTYLDVIALASTPF